jgi:hypothetical protein
MAQGRYICPVLQPEALVPRRALLLSLTVLAACRAEPVREPANAGTVGPVRFHRVDSGPHGMACQLRWLLSPDSSVLLATEDWVSVEAEPFYDGFRLASERTGTVLGRDSVWDVAPSPDWSRAAYGEALIVHAGESDTLPAARLAEAAERLGVSLAEARASQFTASGMVAAAGFARLGVLRLDDGTSRVLPSLTGWRVRWSPDGTRIAGGLGPATAKDDAPSAAWVWMTPAGDSSVQSTGQPLDTATVRWVTGPALDVSVTPDTSAVTLVRQGRTIRSANDTIRVNDTPIGPGTAITATRTGCFILALVRDPSAGRHDPAWRAGIYDLGCHLPSTGAP